ncbi:TPA: hypothetical protein ACPJ1R_002053 [Vibrio alginolyticus]
MSSVIPPKTKPTLRNAMSGTWEKRHPDKCPIWLEIIGWSFVFVPFFFK